MNVNPSVLAEFQNGCIEILPASDLEKKLLKNKPLTIKAGFDPTAPDLHLGHTVLLNKLRQFQDYGHDIVFLVGDFTASIGDPTGKNATRLPLSAEAIIENTKTYEQQVFKILDPKKTRTVFNSHWLNNLNASEIIQLASTYTVARMLERDDFSKRYAAGQAIAIHEFLYPLLQAYDSVMLKADIELGGSDQKFNLLMGRELQKHFSMEPQVVLMMPLLEGVDGIKKMSKSLNNYIGINEDPENIFGKLMSISDELMWKYIDILSNKPISEIKKLKFAVSEGFNPKDVKIDFAWEITARFHGAALADSAKQAFITRFQQRLLPENMPEETLNCDGDLQIVYILKTLAVTKSTSEAIRLINQCAVKVDGERVTNASARLTSNQTYIIQVGKRRIVKVHLALN